MFNGTNQSHQKSFWSILYDAFVMTDFITFFFCLITLALLFLSYSLYQRDFLG